MKKLARFIREALFLAVVSTAFFAAATGRWNWLLIGGVWVYVASLYYLYFTGRMPSDPRRAIDAVLRLPFRVVGRRALWLVWAFVG